MAVRNVVFIASAAGCLALACGGSKPSTSATSRFVAALPPAPSASASAPAPTRPIPPPADPTLLAPSDRTARAASCVGPCNGKPTNELLRVARTNALEARRCYNHALANDPALSGAATVRLALDDTGAVCSASIVTHTFPDETVPECVRLRLAALKYPPPEGGCIEVNVPISFVRP